MKNKKLITLFAVILTSSVMLSACGFGPKEEEDPTVVVTNTPTPAPTVAPVATSTPVPQNTKYNAADGSISIELPNSTWSNKMDEGDTISFESTAGDKLLILHGQGEEAMSEAVLPDTRDNASVLTASADVVEGTDFEIKDYKAEQVNGANVYSYTVNYMNPEKGGGFAAVENYVIANDQEFYSLAGSVKNASSLSAVKAAIKTFKIQGADSTLKSATGTAAGDNKNTQSGTTTQGNTQGNAEGTNGTDTTGSGDGTDTTGGTDENYTENTDGGTYNSGTGSMDLYTSDGVAFGIWQNADGTWSDGDGHTFWFDDNGVAYDQFGNAYSQGESYGYVDNGSGTGEGTDGSGTDVNNNSGSMDLYTSNGVAFGIWQNADGTWTDGDGHTFWFDENGVAYDQFGNAYNS